jgi:hypothetical protein
MFSSNNQPPVPPVEGPFVPNDGQFFEGKFSDQPLEESLLSLGMEGEAAEDACCAKDEKGQNCINVGLHFFESMKKKEKK